jgi:hypothetical protein
LKRRLEFSGPSFGAACWCSRTAGGNIGLLFTTNVAMGFHLLAWFLIATLAGGWTLLCWAAESILGWDGWQRGLDWTLEVPRLNLPSWFTDLFGLEWIEWTRTLLVEFGPWLHDTMSGMPEVTSWVVAAIGWIWGLGLFVLVLFGLIASGLISLARRATKS